MIPNIRARPATLADLDLATETIQLAFASDPVWARALSGPDGRSDHLPAFWRLWIEGALRYPWVWITEAAEAVAVWIPPGGTELSEAQEVAFEQLAAGVLGPDRAGYLGEVLTRFAAAHPHAEPHYYLSLLGTHPDHRGQGIGMALLADNLARIDALDSAAYLESTNPANDQRYARLGFVPDGSFSLPDSGPVVTTMWRSARGRPPP